MTIYDIIYDIIYDDICMPANLAMNWTGIWSPSFNSLSALRESSTVTFLKKKKVSNLHIATRFLAELWKMSFITLFCSLSAG